MRVFKTILCPIDFSDPSYAALEYGLGLAQAAGAKIILAHMLHNPSSEFFREDGFVMPWDKAKERARALLEEARTKYLGGYANTDFVVETGDPHQLIVELARTRKADLIVIATHGRTNLAHLVLGSVAEKVIRYAPCPVFVVRRHDH